MSAASNHGRECAGDPHISPAISDEIGFSLDHLRILTGPICEPCWDHDGEIVPATYTDDHHGYEPATELCESCANREPGDVGEDDGPLSLDQQMAEARRMK